jgi:tRNA-Thr(GGU) m(6)t(6)A37 methyltransferase TsaA
MNGSFELRPIGWIRSSILNRADAPRQGDEGGVDATIRIEPDVLAGMDGIHAGSELIVITWLHQGRRDVLRTHPRNDPANPMTGVFATRSPDRPNPIGLHRVTVRERNDDGIVVGPMEALDGTPVIDIKPVLDLRDR